jgi:GAF domain-containing protein
MLSELAVPIFSSDANAIVGVLNVESPVCNAFSERHKQWLQDLALRAQMVIQRARLSDAHQTIARKVLEMKLDALLAYTSPPYTFFLLNGDMELHR